MASVFFVPISDGSFAPTDATLVINSIPGYPKAGIAYTVVDDPPSATDETVSELRWAAGDLTDGIPWTFHFPTFSSFGYPSNTLINSIIIRYRAKRGAVGTGAEMAPVLYRPGFSTTIGTYNSLTTAYETYGYTLPTPPWTIFTPEEFNQSQIEFGVICNPSGGTSRPIVTSIYLELDITLPIWYTATSVAPGWASASRPTSPPGGVTWVAFPALAAGWVPE